MTTLKARPLSELQPHPLNPKDHDPGLLDASISEFGFIEPVVVDERTGLLLSGHGRVEALRRRFDKGDPPPEQVKVVKGEWMIPTVTGWASRSDEEAHAAMIALNRTTERGGWNEQQLLELLQGFTDDDLLATVGYSEEEVRALERLVEADTTFTDLVTSNQEVIDEFVDDLGGDRDKVEYTYDTVLRVYFQTPEARDDFYKAIGYEPDPKEKTIRYPASWVRQPIPVWSGDDE